MGDDCIFCRIARGEAPASRVYEDAECVAFMDLYPMRPGHVLVVPRLHAVHLHELPEPARAHLFRVATRVMEAQRASGLPWHGGNVVVNDGPAAGQHVPHVHVHVVPRTGRDQLLVLGRMVVRAFSGFGAPGDRGRLDAIAAQIRAHLPDETG